jgi:hypothetical protein
LTQFSGCRVLFVAHGPDEARECSSAAKTQGINPKVVTAKLEQEGHQGREEAPGELRRDRAWLGTGNPVQGQWDVVLVNAPFGPGAAFGRSRAVFWARKAVREGGVVFVDDVRGHGSIPAAELDAFMQTHLGPPVQTVAGTTSGFPGVIKQYTVPPVEC